MSANTSGAPGAKIPFWKRRNVEANLAFWLLMSPMLIGLGLFTFTPIVWGFLISLSEARNSISIGNWVGLNNYADMLRDDQFVRSLRTILDRSDATDRAKAEQVVAFVETEGLRAPRVVVEPPVTRDDIHLVCYQVVSA